MTHFQRPIPNWPNMLSHMPDYSIIKSFDASLLREAKLKWAALGRDPKKLFTLMRYYDMEYFFSNDLQACKEVWRRNYPKFIDATYLKEYVQYVDAVETLNEHTDSRMVTDKTLLKPHLTTEQAAVEVWNTEYRGKIVPEHVQVVIVNGPVGNDIPREFFQLAIDSDNILGYHPYTKYYQKQRDSGDWMFHCGRWDTNERDYDLKPRWAFTECGPYLDAARGWKHPDVLDADENLLIQAMRLYLEGVASTAAYREGRITGPGCYFTSGDPGGWQWYELNTDQLIRLADNAATFWKPGVPMPNPSVDKIRQYANAILAECDKLDPKHTLADKTNQQVINLFHTTFGSYDQLTRAIPSWPTTMAGSPAIRAQLYTGPAIEDMNLTGLEKQRLIAAL